MQDYIQVSGGVCAPHGFTAAGLHCGISKNPDKKDLALIYSQVPCACAGMFTTNKAAAAPVKVTKEHIDAGFAQAILCNSGNANACNPNGMQVAREMCNIAAHSLGLPPKSMVVASTGVIGQPLDIAPVAAAMDSLTSALSDQGSQAAAQAIMTTDLVEKSLSVEFEVEGTRCRIGGIAKGSGMIAPNMATMLCFLTTDTQISPALLGQALSDVVADTFNMVSVDGDTSTNDSVVILANGLAKNTGITDAESPGYRSFVKALMVVCIYLARLMAKDGEGATKLLECSVSGAPDQQTARVLAKSVISSSLFKAAMFGADANWGRVLCAMGYADAAFDIQKTSVEFSSKAGSVLVCRDGAGVSFSEETAKQVLGQPEIEINIGLHQGDGSAVAWGCDLTYDYVKINGDYRS